MSILVIVHGCDKIIEYNQLKGERFILTLLEVSDHDLLTPLPSTSDEQMDMAEGVRAYLLQEGSEA